MVEILLRDTEQHLLNEIEFLEKEISKYKVRSDEIEKKSKVENVKYYNDGHEKLKNALPLLSTKKSALNLLQTEVNKRLRLHKISLVYHNGYFQKTTDETIEEKVSIQHSSDISERIDRYLENPDSKDLLVGYMHSFGRKLIYPSIRHIFGIFCNEQRRHILNFYGLLPLFSVSSFIVAIFVS